MMRAKGIHAAGDPYVTTLLAEIAEGSHVMSIGKGETIFSQGDRAEAIYFVQAGRVKVSVASSGGKEAVLAILGPHDFFGAGSLVSQSLRMSTATALEPAIVFQVERRAMLRALHSQPDLSELFMVSLLRRNIDLEEDVCDQLFNHSEKRLARVLLKLARLHEYEGAADATIPRLSHKTLAEMVGTTRSRITHFMNKFKTMRMIEYNGHVHDNDFGLIVRTERLTDIVLHD
jgi:CRP/FNR family cyclic AMP-dependent transcriptional regulator